MLDVINALSKPGDALKKLKEIRNRQTGKGDTEAEEAPTPSVALATMLINRIKKAGDSDPKDAGICSC